MSDYLIVVVNRASARFFNLEPVEFPEFESGPRMVMRTEIDNLDINDFQEMVTDSKTGRGAAPQGAGIHGYDDKRDQHLDELRRRFAVKVLDQIRRLAKTERVRTVILATSSRMRRFLYPDIDTLERQGIRVHKLSKNMINFAPQKIHEYLAQEGIVPHKKRVTA
jgi:hypothetical protein